MTDSPRDLGRTQRWLQSVIMHPDGVEQGVESPAARREVDLAPDQVEQIIERSQALTSLERLSIYSNAYYARLIECMQATFPMLAKSLGEELFDEFAFAYLQDCPSQSYTLDHLGDRFAQFLEQTRGDVELEDDHQGPDFLIDLARLEWTFDEVFDGPGNENEPPLQADQLLAIPPDQWPQARLTLAPCVRLLALRYPVNAYYTALRADENPPPPERCDSYIAVSRRDYIVRRHDLTRAQFELLGSLQSGESVGTAIERATGRADQTEVDFAAALKNWFQTWTTEGFFTAVSINV